MPEPAASTRDRLIEAAGEVFAETGFREATIRDICTRAGANVAAVNYHFGGKDGLYRAVLEHAEFHAAPRPDAQPPARTPDEHLRGFVTEFMLRLLDRGKPAWQSKIIAREMIDPTEALDLIIDRTIRQRWNMLLRIVEGVLGPGADPALVGLSAASIIGQCVMYKNSAPIIDRLLPPDLPAADEARRRADHVARFSLAALHALRRAPVTVPDKAGDAGGAA